MLSHMLATSVQPPQATVDTIPQPFALNGQCDAQNAECHIKAWLLLCNSQLNSVLLLVTMGI